VRSYAWAKAQRILLCDGVLTVCPSTPGWSISEVRRQFGETSLRRVRDDELDGLLATAYADTGSAAAVVGAAENEVDLDRLMQDMPEITDLLDTQDGAPVIRMINALLTQAARDEASDIHIEPFETHSVVRYRVDGTLRDVVSPRKALHGALVSRIKIMAQLDIAEKRLPQDGRIALRVAGRPIDIRVSTVPTGHGERVVMRLLDKQAGRLHLETLGMDAQVLATRSPDPPAPRHRAGHRPHRQRQDHQPLRRAGAAGCQHQQHPHRRRPGGVRPAGISQIQVNAKIDMTFALALRAILRQDPDIIMIGEIRDLETAQIAVQASLTGHLVLATLHTNDAVSAVNRLIDMGVEPFLLASSLLGVLAQRLVRRLCPQCKQEDPAAPGTWRPVGCAPQPPRLQRAHRHPRIVLHRRRHAQPDPPGAGEQALRAARPSRDVQPARGRRALDRSGATAPEEILRVTRDA
jgi:general secretion pathway protein E